MTTGDSRVADKLYRFSNQYGHLVGIALAAVAEEQGAAADRVEKERRNAGYDTVTLGLRESQQEYKAALTAWEALLEAVEEEL